MLNRAPAVVLAVVVVVAGACTSSSRPAWTDEQLRQREAADEERARVQFESGIARLCDRLSAELAAHDADRSKPEPHVDILAMSGGGDYGAFGAGVLVGWGSVEEQAKRRPRFDVVTGVSTGALLAPFAFLGTDEDSLHVETFYRNPRTDWVQSRGLLFFLPHLPSFMETPGLERDLKVAVDDAMIERIAQRSREGCLLAVSATNLDFGTQRVWDLGAMADAATTPEERDRVRDVLRASAAIPAVFPPVEVEDELYVDGGVTANVLLRLDPEAPGGLMNVWRERHGDRPLPRVRYWIIVNNQAHAPPRTVQPRWPAIVGPSLATAIRSATLAEIRWLAAQAKYVNAVRGTRIEMRVLTIPDSWRPPVEGDFKKETMDSLADLGRRLGAEPSSWSEWVSVDASPGEAPR